jgi:hypothetical protein
MYCVSRRAGEQGPHQAHGRCALPARTQPAGSRRFAGITSPAGRPVERTGTSRRTARPHGHRRPPKVTPVQDPSRPSRPTYGPRRRLLFLALEEQLDALSDEGRGLLVPGVRDQPPHEVPRRLIHAEGDDSRSCFHSLSSFACGHGRRSNPIRPSAVLFIENRNDAESCRSHIVDWPLLTLKRYARLWIAAAQNER